MLDEDLMEEIDRMDYIELLNLWRFADTGSPYFRGEVGNYFVKIMYKKRDELAPGEAVKISKEIGWKG